MTKLSGNFYFSDQELFFSGLSKNIITRSTKNEHIIKIQFLFLLAAGLFLNVAFTRAQTNVGGGIYSSTTWTKANSPYIVTGDIVLFPDKTLTIEPGVEVKFNGYFTIEIRGTLIAIGSVADTISFISNTSLSKSAWAGIKIPYSTQNANGLFRYCKVKHSFSGVTVECSGGDNSSYIKNSLFDNNKIASSGYAGWNLPIDNCVFTNNTYAITEGNKIIKNSTFINNTIGINCEVFEARNCFFQNNGSAIDWPVGTSGDALIDSCTIVNNNIGVRINNGSITNNIISNNIIGVITGHLPSTGNDIEYFVPIKNNHICNNTQYNIENNNSYNKNISLNCFCTTDSTTIENKLFDGYDDISIGLFNYDIYDLNCQTVTRSIFKVGPSSSVNTVFTDNPNISISPNPFNDVITIQMDNRKNKIYSLRIYNIMGQKVQQVESIIAEQKIIDSRSLGSGIYLLQLIQDNIIIGQKKLIKE